MLEPVKPAEGATVSLREFIKKYPILLVLGAATFMVQTCYAMMLALVPMYFRNNIVVPHDIYIGLAISAYVFSETLAKPFAGWAGDKLKRTSLVMVALALAASTPHLLSRASSPITFVGIRLIDGIGAALLWPSIIALFADVSPEKNRATAMSMFTLCMVAGGAIGFALCPFLRVQYGSYYYVFFTISGIMSVAFLMMAGFSGTINDWAARKKKSEPRREDEDSNNRGLKKIFASRRQMFHLGVLVVLAFTQMFGASALVPGMQLFTHDVLGWRESQMWRAFALVGGMFALVALPAGRIADRIGKENAVKIGFFLSSSTLLLMYYVRSPWTLALAALGNGTGFVLGAPSWIALITRSEWADIRGTVLGTVTAFQGAGAIAGPPVALFIYNQYGPHAPFGLIGWILGVCILIAMIGLHPDPETKDST